MLGAREDDLETIPTHRVAARAALEVPIVAALAVAIVVVLRAFVVQPFFIPSVSMVPQLKVNDKILVSRLSYRLHPIHRGDLVVFSQPPGFSDGPPPSHPTGIDGIWHSVGERLGLVPRSDELVKRVVGLPGETVEGIGGHVYIDGQLLLEPYLPPGTVTPDFSATVIPKGMLWVMGDNRQNSDDSHVFGPIRERTIVGLVAILRIWPLDDLSFL